MVVRSMVVAVLLATATPVTAQNASENAIPRPAEGRDDEAIVITATRGERRLLDVPVFAIAQTARLMILDEITAFLDLPGRVQIMALLRRHARATGTIVLLSSHDLDLSLQLADQVWLVANGGVTARTASELIGSGTISTVFDTADVVFSPERHRFELVNSESLA